MIWLYRLQQRIAITQYECIVILVVALLFGIGLVVQAVEQEAHPLPEAAYEEADRLFYERTAPGTPVPSETDAKIEEESTDAARHPVPQVNLNTATVAELQQLPRIGPKMAQRIIDYRTQRGLFRTVEELGRVRGIGPKTLAGITPHVTVDTPAP